MKRRYKVTKLMLYEQTPRIIRELRIRDHDRKPSLDELNGANDILYRLFSDEAIRIIARKLHRRPQAVFDALDATLSLPIAELHAPKRKMK